MFHYSTWLHSDVSKRERNSGHCNVKCFSRTIFPPFPPLLLCKTAALQQPAAQLQLLHDNVPQFNYILQERRDGVNWVRAVLKESGEKSFRMSHGDDCNATMERTILLRDETVHFGVGVTDKECEYCGVSACHRGLSSGIRIRSSVRPLTGDS